MENAHFSARPFYLVAKALGAFVYSYDGPYYKGDLKLSVPGIVWNGLVVIGYIIMFIANAVVRESVLSTSTILALAWETSLTISFATLLVTKFCQMFKQKSILKFLKTIDEIDRNVVT